MLNQTSSGSEALDSNSRPLALCKRPTHCARVHLCVLPLRPTIGPASKRGWLTEVGIGGYFAPDSVRLAATCSN